MGQCEVVAPEIVRLTLSSGATVDVIKEMNAGEYFDLIVAMANREPFAKILAYVMGWSLVGLDGQPLPYSVELPLEVRRDTVRGQSKRFVRELIAALDRHEAAEEAAVAAKKKTDPPAPGSSAISTSAAP